MDNTAEEGLAAKRAHDIIERLLRRREDVIEDKRAMRQELAQSLGQEQLSSPLALIDPDTPISLSDPPQEKQKAFIEALRKNMKLQQELSRLRADHKAAASLVVTDHSPAVADAERRLLAEQLECNRLEKERQRLEALKKFHDELSRQPAASPDFLDSKIMFKGCAPFPEIPKELVEGFTKDQDPPGQEIKDLIAQLRRETLRQKILLARDRRRLEAVRAKNPVHPKDLPPERQVAALNAVKESLVDWIEVMLSKAGESEAEEGVESPSKKDATSEAFDRGAQLADIEKEYKRHIDLRKQIMASMAQLRKLRDTPRPPPLEKIQAPETPLPARSEPQTYLLTPYLEKLQALSHEQKRLVQEKAHIHAAITRQQQDANKILRRLTHDSKLLSDHAPPVPERRQSGMSFAKATKRFSVTEQIQPWLFAADSAKIATLEAVAEAVDKGQMSIDDTVQALDQVSILQNKGPLEMPGEGGATSPEQDAEPGEPGENDEKKGAKDQLKSIWSVLDGNLGLINE
ncbi:hypothetical protein GGR50DRAFT_601467 [Xylaria sp. CBS 124048]|nr:hypothetical protein GGR50DRAFT_601467 [Xylaria sp. CBS 124048]